MTSGCTQAFVVAGILSATVLYDAIHAALASGLAAQFVLDSPAASDFGPWSNSQDPQAGTIYTSFYVYNVTNPDEASRTGTWKIQPPYHCVAEARRALKNAPQGSMSPHPVRSLTPTVVAGPLFCELQIVFNGSKPNVQEIGPITYAYNKHYQNNSWAPEDDGDLLTYYRYNWYERADDGSSAAFEALNVTTLNLPLLGLINSPVVNENPINIDVVAGLMAAVGYDGKITGPLCTQPVPCWPGQSQIHPFARHCSPPPSLPPSLQTRARCL